LCDQPFEQLFKSDMNASETRLFCLLAFWKQSHSKQVLHMKSWAAPPLEVGVRIPPLSKSGGTGGTICSTGSKSRGILM